MKNKIKEFIPYLAVILLVILIRSFLITPAIVDGASMEKTLYNNEVVILNKIVLKTKGIDRFDIVVIKYGDEFLIKRAIGLPNETIEYRNNNLYIDGKVVKTPIEFERTNDFKATLSNDEYFVLGDNRDDSVDSRMIGNININKIKGKVNFVLFPFSKFGKVE